MKTKHKYVGLDVHKDTTVIAVAEEGRNGEIRDYGTISSDLHALEKALTKIGSDGSTLHVVYEAGPTGFVVYRRLQQLHLDCVVVAPSKTPRHSGDKLKTDRRDAAKLARLHRAGELTSIHVPDAVDESIRDLCRARSDAMQDLRRAKQRLKMFLLRLGCVHLAPKVSAHLSRRQEGQPEIFKTIGWKAQTRLHKRYWQLAARKVMTAKIQIAVARELTGFVWDVLRHAWEKHFPAAPSSGNPSPSHGHNIGLALRDSPDSAPSHPHAMACD